MLLLDSLDEIGEQERRCACIEAINAYRRDNPFLPIVVCSRTDAYVEVTTSARVWLRLEGAVIVNDLTEQQIENYLIHYHADTTGLRAALQKDEALYTLIRSPYLLTVAAESYA